MKKDIIFSKLKKDTIFGVLLAFICTTITLTVIYAYFDIWPMGENTSMFWDMKAQYSAFMSWYINCLNGKADFPYSLNGALGTNMVGLVAYYLASPLNIILKLATPRNLPYYITIITYTKIGISAATMQYYLNKKRKGVYSIIFASCYALSSFVICFGYNLMWLDAYMLLPLLMYCLELLILGDNGVKYAIVLGVIIASNYYIGYMVCLFCLLYYVATVIYKNQYSTIINFIKMSLLGGGLSAIIILPGIMTLQYSSSGRVVSIKDILDFSFMFNPIIELRYFFPGSFDENQGIIGKYPLVYVGLFAFFASIYFFISSKNSLRQKIYYGSMLLLLFCSMLIKGSFLIWHGFSMPSGCWWRFSFFFMFLVLVVGYEQISKSKVFINNIWAIVVVLLSFVELVYNGIIIIDQQFSNEIVDVNYYKDNHEEFSFLKSCEDVQISPHRSVILNGFGDSLNKGLLYNINGINMYSSTESEETWNVYGALGLGKPNWESDSEYDQYATKLVTNILGVKYIYDFIGRNHNGFEMTNEISNEQQMYNEYAMPLGFLVNENAKKIEYKENIDVIENQNEILRALLGANNETSMMVIGNSESALSEFENYELTKNPRLYRMKDGMYTDGDRIAIENTDIVDYVCSKNSNYTIDISFEGKKVLGTFDVPEGDERKYACFSIGYDDGFSAKVDGHEADIVKGMGGLIMVPISDGKHTVELIYRIRGLKIGIIITVISFILLIGVEIRNHDKKTKIYF